MGYPTPRSSRRVLAVLQCGAYVVMVGGVGWSSAWFIYETRDSPGFGRMIVWLLTWTGAALGLFLLAALLYVGFFASRAGFERVQLAVLRGWMRVRRGHLFVLDGEPPEMRAWIRDTLCGSARIVHLGFTGRCAVAVADGRDALAFKIRFY